MNQQPDAAGRVQAYLDARDQLITAGATLTDQIAEAKSGSSPWARLLMADLREVLAELADARQQLDALKTQYGASLYPGGPIHLLDDDRVETWRNSGHHLESRLVGEWTEADKETT